MADPATPRRRRMAYLRHIKARIDNELLVLEAAEQATKRPRGQKPPCGTEQAYQRHAHYGDTEANGYRVNCVACRKAHAAHERVADARRKLEREAS